MYTEFEQQVGFLLHDISRLIRKAMAARMSDLNISEARWRVLGTISRAPGIGQTQAAELLAMSKASLGSLLDKLELEQLVERRPHPTDRRAKQLLLTANATPITRVIRERYASLEKEFNGGLSAVEEKQLHNCLRSIYAYLADSDESNRGAVGELQFAQLVGSINRLIKRHFESQLKDIGFSRPQWLVLTGIHKHEGLQQNALAKQLTMEKAPLGVVVDELENAGWVKRCPDPKDRRAKQLFLTTECVKRLESIKDALSDLHKKLLANIKAKQRQKFIHSLNRIRSNLQLCAADTDAQS